MLLRPARLVVKHSEQPSGVPSFICIDNRFRKYVGIIAVHYGEWHKYTNASVANAFNNKFNNNNYVG